jgi:hypothetical protein
MNHMAGLLIAAARHCQHATLAIRGLTLFCLNPLLVSHGFFCVGGADVFARIKMLEDRLLSLESLAPEVFAMMHQGRMPWAGKGPFSSTSQPQHAANPRPVTVVMPVCVVQILYWLICYRLL